MSFGLTLQKICSLLFVRVCVCACVRACVCVCVTFVLAITESRAEFGANDMH